MASQDLDWRESTNGQFVVGRELDLRSLLTRVTAILLIVWWASIVISALTPRDIEFQVEGAAKATADGSALNRILVLSFALLGALHMGPALRSIRARSCAMPLLFLGLYLTWGQASVFWSTDPSLSIRRLLVFAFVLVGAFGVGAGFYGQMRNGVLVLARHVLCAALISFAIAALSRISETSWAELLDPQWSLKGELPVFHFAYHCGLGAVAALALAFAGRRKYVLLAVLCLLCLVVLKTRTLLISSTALCAITYAYFTPSNWVRRGVSILAIVLLSVVVDLSTGGYAFHRILIQNGVFERWLPYVTIDAGADNLYELSGRRPLWGAVAGAVERRPLTGHGFGAFWTPRQLRDIRAKVGWPAVHAHNGFLDELLATGLIGLVLFLAFWFSAMYSSLQLARGPRRVAGGLVAIWLFAFLCFNAMDTVMQIFFQVPTLVSLTALAALWGMDGASGSTVDAPRFG